MKLTFGLVATITAVFFVVNGNVAMAHTEDRIFQNGTDLLEWCKAESEAVFVGKGQTPFNWTASHLERGNALVVDGKWRVGGETIEVQCKAARGAQARYATLTIRAGA